MSRRILTFSLFEAARTAGLTQEQEEFLNKYTEGSWTYDLATGLVDVNGNFNCYSERLKTLSGVKFGKVRGDFDCFNNQLTTLEGAPQEVGGNFNCGINQLTSLAGAPRKVEGYFDCRSNQLTTLEGAPQEVGRDFSCDANQLTTLEGAPQKVGGLFDCDAFSLESGEWNLEVWLKILKEGSPEAQQLIATILSPEDLNQEIRKDPTGMIMKLKEVWNDESFRETRDKLVWPRGYEQEAGLVGDLDDIGF